MEYLVDLKLNEKYKKNNILKINFYIIFLVKIKRDYFMRKNIK